MGFFCGALTAAAGFVFARALIRTSASAVRVPVSSTSILVSRTKKRNYVDTYRAQLPDGFRLAKKRVGRDLNVTDVARAFFACPVFYHLERPLLKIFLRFPEPTLWKVDFSPGEQIYCWTVASKNDEEILLGWQVGRGTAAELNGTTWFCLPKKEQDGAIYFGSTFVLPGILGSSTGRGLESVYSNWDVLKRVFANIRQSRDAKEAIKKLPLAVILPIHILYSRCLLYSTMKTLTLS